MAAATPEIAIVAKLKGGSTAAGSRVYPEVNTPEPTYPFVTVNRLGAEGGKKLSGKSNALKPYTIQVDHYAETAAGRNTLAGQTRALLAPDGTPWTDAANGIRGCFFQDSAEEAVPTEAGDMIRVVRETYLVWHFPT